MVTKNVLVLYTLNPIDYVVSYLYKLLVLYWMDHKFSIIIWPIILAENSASNMLR